MTNDPVTADEEHLGPAELAAMARARQLAEMALGRTSPNPPVGAVILDRAGNAVGEGHTRPAGQEHAEVVALARAGTRADGGTAVVTLEPCNHTGRTGPCVDALLAAGIARVVFAVPDPTRSAAGGARRLAASGLEVVAGVQSAEAAGGALRWWLRAEKIRRPIVVWKYASTLDGRIAAADGTSQWISSPQSRADVQRLRAQVDAIVVGSGTVRADDPALTVRSPDGVLATHQPLRVVLDRRGTVASTARVHDDSAESLFLAEPEPAAVLQVLWDQGIRAVLLEGGPTVAGAFLRAGAIDEVVAYLAPALLGAGAAALRDAGIDTIADVARLRLRSVEQIGPDIKITATTDGTHDGDDGWGGSSPTGMSGPDSLFTQAK